MASAWWTDLELEATAKAYLQMLELQQQGQAFSKTSFRNGLLKGALKARSAPSVEYRMRNISAVLHSMRRPWLNGYAPATNVGQSVRKRLGSMIERIERSASNPLPTSSTPAAPMVFFNIGWMKDYAGIQPEDLTIGGHGHLSENDHGYESFNFKPRVNRMFGYRPGEQKNLEISKLGASKNDMSVDGVLVVWMAREPKSKKTRIVGWYKDATVFRTASSLGRQAGHTFNNTPILYTATAQEEDSILLPVANREFEVPSARTQTRGYGQSVTWYGGSDSFRERVRAYIETIEINAHAAGGTTKPPRNQDAHLRRLVERTAVDHAIAHFSSPTGGGYSVRSVELEAKGWDLEAQRGGERLLIEVKGLSGPTPICELTPNEYAKMLSVDYRDAYVIYFVTQCLSANPLSHVFRRESQSGDWVTPDGRSLNFTERMAAILRVDPPSGM